MMTLWGVKRTRGIPWIRGLLFGLDGVEGVWVGWGLPPTRIRAFMVGMWGLYGMGGWLMFGFLLGFEFFEFRDRPNSEN